MTNDWKEMVRRFCLRTIRQFHFLLDLLDKQPNYVKKKKSTGGQTRTVINQLEETGARKGRNW